MTPGTTGTLIGQTLGGYRLTGLLGAGGMAEVYRAEDVKLGREVAVKVLPATLAADAGYVERFRNEARQVAALNHPNVVPVYHFDEERGLLFLVMPVLKESLRDRMEREGPLPPSEAGRVVVQIAAALDAAHALGLVHRDVKPENILINSEGRALLTDFGIARELSFLRESGTARTLAATGLPVGTPEYMAPEQLRAAAVDQRADIYALGAVLYELLTGAVPHDAPTPYEVAALVLTAPLRPPSQLNPVIWPELDAVVVTALAKDANDRYVDTRSFALALRRAVLGRDASVHRYTMPLGAFDGSTLAALRALNAAGDSAGTEGQAGAEGAASVRTDVAGAAVMAPAGRQTWRQRLQQRPAGGRKTLLIAAVVALLLIAVCGGSSLALLSHLSLSPIGTGIQSPFGGVTDTLAGQTPGSTSTTGSGGGTTAHNSATATAGAAATATATSEGTPAASPTPTDTVGPGTPTPTTLPSPTATTNPVVPSLSFSSFAWTQSGRKNRTCSGTQSVSNTGTDSVAWSWTGAAPPLPPGFLYGINSSPSLSGMPTDASLSASSTDTLNVSMPCGTGTTISITVTATDNLSNRQMTYRFILSPPAGG